MKKLKIVALVAVLIVLGSLAIALSVAKFNNLKNLAKKATPVAAACLVVAMPLAGVGGVDVASAQKQKVWDPYHSLLDIGDGFKAVGKSMDEPIFPPEEISKKLFGEAEVWYGEEGNLHRDFIEGVVKYDEEGNPHYDTFEISPTDCAVWIDKKWITSLTERESRRQLYPVDTDGDGLPEILMCGLNEYAVERMSSGQLSNYKYFQGYYILDPFHKPKNEDMPGFAKLLYTNLDYKIVPFIGEDIIKPKNWDDVVNKTRAEIGLDKYDRGIFGRTPSQISSPAETTPSEVPTGEEKGIPGFEAAFAVVGLLAVVYILRRSRK